ncbi:MAG: hypothetical protein Q9215_007588 [Flavoplaca cf. flavocitrina]
MILQTHRALARLSQCSSQCLDKQRFTALALNLTRVVSSRRADLGNHEATDILRFTLLTPAISRTYATDAVSRPKAHTGRTTSSPRKKSSTVKTTASATDVKPAAAATMPAAKKTKAKSKPNAKSGAKPRTRAKSTKARKKPAKAKAKPAKKKKALKPEVRERLEIKELKAKALSPPKRVPDAAFSVLLAEKQQELRTFDSSGSVAKECSKLYRSFTNEQREHYNHIANQNKASYDTKYREWILSHSPLKILEANNARAALKKRSKGQRSWPKLHDERLVTRQRGPYIKFSIQRHRSGDFAGIPLGEAGKLIAAEWRELSEDEKKPFFQEAEQDMARYEQEVKAVYDRAVKHEKAKA